MSSPFSQKRVPLACTVCRGKKIRCDGKLPSCTRCAGSRTQCIYDHNSDKRKPPSKTYVAALLARINILELQLRQSRSLIDSGHGEPSQVEASSGIDCNSNAPSSFEEDGGVNTDLVEISEMGDIIADLSRIYGRLDIAEDGHLRYFGAPSYFNLLRRPQYDRYGLGSFDHVPDHETEDHEIVSGLPHYVEAELLEHFWTWQNPWQYLVHKRAFCEALEKRRYDAYCTPLLFQCILALGARYSDRSEVQDTPGMTETAGNALAEQAKAILHFEMESPTTSTVTSLAVLALREMSVNKEALGWTYVGMAIRIAYNLGLNHDCTSWVQQGKITEDEAEIRKITWWGCYLLDKLFVVALGRPGMISQREISVPKPSLLQEVEFAPWSDCNPPANLASPLSRSVSNMNTMCEIFEIASETLEEIYAPNSSLNLTQKQEMANRAYVKVVRFYNKIPAFLKLVGLSKESKPAHVYSLHLQYYVIVILLHRPFLRLSRAFYPEKEIARHNKVCAEAAEQITAIVRAYRRFYSLRRIPISTVHAVGTASIIQLIGATSSDERISRAAIRAINYNIMFLHEMSVAWSWSKRAIKSLQILMEDWSIKAKAYPRSGDQISSTVDHDSTEISTRPSESSEGETEAESQAMHLNLEREQITDSVLDYNFTWNDIGSEQLAFEQHIWPAIMEQDE